MSGNVSLYPIFNKRISDNVGYERALIRFYYNNEAGDKELISITDSMHSPEITLNDARNQWYIDKHNLIIEFTLYFEDLTKLFGQKGIVPSGGSLGMAVEWSSRESMLRGVSKFHTVDINDELTKTYIEGTLILEKHTLRKNLDLSFFFYLEKEDLNATIYEGHLASLKGTRLGVFDNLRLVLEGHGTDFPLTEYHQVKEPLWKIMSTWNDPFTDSFSDNISIFINRAHNNYKFLDPDDTKNFNKILMDEIILSAMNVIIWKVISFETWQFKDDYVISQDSVAAAVLHFIDTFNLSIDSEESLSNSLRAIKMELSEEL